MSARFSSTPSTASPNRRWRPTTSSDEAIAAGIDGSHGVTLHAKMLRLELLQVKADLERNLGALVLDCSDCGQTVHYVFGLGVTPGHWAHREPSPHGEPVVKPSPAG